MFKGKKLSSDDGELKPYTHLPSNGLGKTDTTT
jgi:hypothetical protein